MALVAWLRNGYTCSSPLAPYIIVKRGWLLGVQIWQKEGDFQTVRIN